MGRTYIFADEAGDLTFSRERGATRFFTFTTVTMQDCTIAEDLLRLRRELAWKGALLLPDGFHATNDRQAVRDRVFDALERHQFAVDATVFEKPKALPRSRSDQIDFYRLAWRLHFKFLVHWIPADDEVLVLGATIGTKRKRTAAQDAIRDVVQAHDQDSRFATACWPASTDPCLQIADYCGWAIQRKWEHGDERSYRLIKDKIRSEFDAFAGSSETYY